MPKNERDKFVVKVDDRSPTTIHFRHVASMATIVDTGFVSFTLDIEETLIRTLKMALTLNNTYAVTMQNAGLKPFAPAVKYIAQQSQQLYKQLCLSLAPWDLHTFDSSVEATKIKKTTHKKATQVLNREAVSYTHLTLPTIA